MQKESLSSSMPKLIVIIGLVVSIGSVFGILGYYLTRPRFTITPVAETISTIEISANKRAILDANTKKAIFTIEETKEFLQGFKYEISKYSGDCFRDASLSNNKKIVVFSTDCISSGNLSNGWVGIYNFAVKSKKQHTS